MPKLTKDHIYFDACFPSGTIFIHATKEEKQAFLKSSNRVSRKFKISAVNKLELEGFTLGKLGDKIRLIESWEE